MTKNEVIEKAYGEHFEEMKPFIDENGWFDKNSFYNNQFSFNYEQLDKSFTHSGDFMRPPELNNIENNNGWIDPLILGLPQKHCNVFFVEPIDNDGEKSIEIHIGFWDNKGKFFSYDNSEKYLFDEISHYKIIDEPAKPLY